MPRNRHTVEQIMSTLREADVALRKGQPVVHVCRALGIIQETNYDSLVSPTQEKTRGARHDTAGFSQKHVTETA